MVPPRRADVNAGAGLVALGSWLGLSGLTIIGTGSAMPRITRLDKQWQQLMALCESESKFRSEGVHSRLLKLVASDIEALAAEMGFSPHRIATRDFRAQRDGHHIVGIIAD
jgi:hypothetical protein